MPLLCCGKEKLFPCLDQQEREAGLTWSGGGAVVVEARGRHAPGAWLGWWCKNSCQSHGPSCNPQWKMRWGGKVIGLVPEALCPCGRQERWVGGQPCLCSATGTKPLVHPLYWHWCDRRLLGGLTYKLLQSQQISADHPWIKEASLTAVTAFPASITLSGPD